MAIKGCRGYWTLNGNITSPPAHWVVSQNSVGLQNAVQDGRVPCSRAYLSLPMCTHIKQSSTPFLGVVVGTTPHP